MSEIFISYRGADARAYGALLYVGLESYLGPELVFIACMSIPAGHDYAVELLTRVRFSTVLLAVIGPGWLEVRDAAGERRIDDPQDWVRRELLEAYAAGVRVIPVLTDGARLPVEAELPPDIEWLARCQYRYLRTRDVVSDLDRLRRDLAEASPRLAAAARRGRIWAQPLLWVGYLAGWALSTGRRRDAGHPSAGSRSDPRHVEVSKT